MTKIDALRRVLLPCFTSTTTNNPPIASATTTTKKRLSTSLRDDIDEITKPHENPELVDQEDDESLAIAAHSVVAPPRPSKTMVIGTIFGQRRGHVWFCVQHDRLKTRPSLLLELSIATQSLVQEMRHGLVRVALECHNSPESELGSCPLHSIPVWTMFCNGRKLGFAVRRKATDPIRLMLKSMQSTTVGAGVIPSVFGSGSDTNNNAGGELMYMRANYECVVGGPDSESFHLINPDGCPGQELSIFLLRSSKDIVETREGAKDFPLCNFEGKAIVRETDMPEGMQSHVMELAYQALDLHEVSDCQSIAHNIKQTFDETYGPAWHCVVGKDFGSCITHLRGSFIFFHVEMIEFLIFKDGKDFNESKDEVVGVLQKTE